MNNQGKEILQNRPLFERDYDIEEQYSYYNFAAGAVAAGKYRIFTTPLGNTGQGYGYDLTRSETSLDQAGRMPAEFGIVVEAIAVVLHGGLAEDGDAVLDVSDMLRQVVRLKFQNNLEFELGRIARWPAGGGAYGTLATGAASTFIALNNGNPTNGAIRKLSKPLPVPANTSVSGEIEVTTGFNLTVPIEVGVHLIGPKYSGSSA